MRSQEQKRAENFLYKLSDEDFERLVLTVKLKRMIRKAWMPEVVRVINSHWKPGEVPFGVGTIASNT